MPKDQKDDPAFLYFPANYRWSMGLLICLSAAPWTGVEIDEVNRALDARSGRRLPSLSGRQRHDRRALHVGLDRRRAQAGSLIRPVRDEPGILKMSTSPIYLTEADVGRLATVKDAIATLEALFATWGQPSTSNLPRQRATCGRRLQPDGRGLWSEGGARPQGLCRREGRA